MYTKVFSWFCLSENIEVNLSSMKIHTGFVFFKANTENILQISQIYIDVY